MPYLPTRIMVPLKPPVSRALGQLTDKLGSDDPRQVAAVLIERGLEQAGELTSLCPRCNHVTVPHPDPAMAGVRYCERCNESVGYVPDNGAAARTAQAVQ